MFHSLLQNRAALWASSSDCPLRAQLDYMRTRGYLRQVQIDAIQTYLFLKIRCGNQPLCDLFSSGQLNTIVPDDLRISQKVRDYLASHPASLSLLQIASQKKAKGNEVLAQSLKDRLESEPESIDATSVFKELFYGVSYPDYLFSLPMGAGKTFLMAALMYLDLAFALQEPDNLIFAKNFLVLAPSGLKSSIVPSLRTIQSFDPSWVVAEPLASQLRRQIKFLVLDAESSAKQSNRVRNPNAQKLTSLQPFEDLCGLIAVVNAEKVILDHLDTNSSPELLPKTADEKEISANETRALLGKIPAMSIFIDEAHHAAPSEIKLRSVVSQWAQSGNIRTVLGFSGTPYLNSPQKLIVAQDLEIKATEITNTVHYYPLVEGIGTFLKKPLVRIVNDAHDSLSIVQRGITEFLEKYRNKRYSSGAWAKLAIYCGTISRLEEQIYPLAAKLCEAQGLSPAQAILKYHRGNKDFPTPSEAESGFAALDEPFSQIRIVLLVQIGKEGWNCRSLTGVILSQEGDCPNNMVLQTSCRCLREVDKNCQEDALIVLNNANGQLLSTQLSKQQHATLDEFQNGIPKTEQIERFDRTGVLNLPTLPFYQLSISYSTEVHKEAISPDQRLHALFHDLPKFRRDETVQETTFEELLAHGVKERSASYAIVDAATPSCPFQTWLSLLQKESFGFWSRMLTPSQENLLRKIHSQISFTESGEVFLSKEYDQAFIRSRVITAFWPRRRLVTREEMVPANARLLRIEHFVSPIEVSLSNVPSFVPTQIECRKIHDRDLEGSTQTDGNDLERLRQRLAEAEADGDPELARLYRQRIDDALIGRGGSDCTYHYLPYRTDSGFERNFLTEVLQRKEFRDRNLEIYYNGDASLTEFRIHCYKRLPKAQGEGWTSVGIYTPDFLILHRDKVANAIDACLIVETKGKLYANDPDFQSRRAFVQSDFLQRNASHPGLPRFQYLYLEETVDWERQIVDTITEFFN